MTPTGNRITVLDTDYATLWYYPESKVIHHVFHRYIHGQHFRGVLEAGLEALKQHGGTKWLSDDRNNSTIPTEDLVWTFENWSPRCVQAGWKHWGLILPTKIGGQMSMNRTMQRYIDMGISVEIFDDPDKAMQWLLSLP
jgi:ribonucleotide reductase alpha subunit